MSASLSSAPADVVNTVSVKGLTRTFGANTVLRQLDLEIEAGSFVALLGRSGSARAASSAACTAAVSWPSMGPMTFQR